MGFGRKSKMVFHGPVESEVPLHLRLHCKSGGDRGELPAPPLVRCGCFFGVFLGDFNGRSPTHQSVVFVLPMFRLSKSHHLVL